MAGRIVRLVCIILMSLWLTSKAMVLSPLIAIPLIGCTVVYTINEIKEMQDEKKHAKSSRSRRKKVKSTKS